MTAWDDFATPAQIGEIHRLGLKEYPWDTLEMLDERVRERKGKWPQELTREEADTLIREWGGR